MTPLTRIWLAFSALGAGLIHLAVGAGAPLPLALPLAGLGVAEFGWGVVVLMRGAVPWRRRVHLLALVPVLVWGAALATATVVDMSELVSRLPFLPLAVASTFNVFIAVTAAVAARRRAAGRPTPVTAAPEAPQPQGWRFVGGLIAAALLVAGLTTPALASTEAGTHAVPHGTHSPHSGH